MSSAGYDRIDMFDASLIHLGLESGDGLSNKGIVTAGNDVEPRTSNRAPSWDQAAFP
jgi:hypothetical protein